MEWGVDGEKFEGEREQWINGARDRALVRSGSGMGQKWSLEKLNT
jgi:hypothetical protein